MNQFKQFLYYCIVFAAPILLATTYKNVANFVPLLFLLLLFISWKEVSPGVTKQPLIIFFIIFISFIFLSGFWSYRQEEAIERIIKIMLLLLPACILLGSGHPGRYMDTKYTWWCLVVSFLLSIALTGWQLGEDRLLKNLLTGRAGGEHVSAYLNPAVICLVILLWPLLALLHSTDMKLHTRVLVTTLCVIALVALVFYGNSDTAWVAGILGATAYVLIRFGLSPGIFKPFIVASIIIAVVASPVVYDRLPVKNYKIDSDNFLVQQLAQSSYLHRIEIWDRCIELIAERPLLGWGMAASLNLPKLNEPSKIQYGQKRTDFMYPHNVFIQCLLEYGAIGLALFLLWLNALINWISKTPAPLRAYYSAAFITTVTVYSFGFPMWRSWWIVFLAVIPVIFMAANRQHEAKPALGN
ncbi:MAG: O-antigen ligase family protein [Gammaproteobacteria bacterium]